MNNRHSVSEAQEQYWQLWIYLLPIAGIIPAIWTLSRKKGNTRQQKVSRVAINLLLTWSSAYILLLLSADRTSDLLAFRVLYANALLTTGYFLTCLWLMTRLKAGKIPHLFVSDKSSKVSDC
ncbi:hypothetical protein [Myxosarcina sp. GI1]|uniref:hypothetical protein n=1 Tax=Myxosarcina sp. GI1 TaxID=1541065 RepID=UPI000691685F|nr:hypothetical protein [Myxosarcina sp. GI1]